MLADRILRRAPRPTLLVLPVVLAQVLVLATMTPARADEHPSGPAVDDAYATWLDTYGDWERADVEKAGYDVDAVCVSAAAEGLPAELGGMGYHAVHMGYATSGELDVDRPHALLLDGDDRVLGVEYEWPTVEDPAPEIVKGLPLELTPPHPGMEHEHMSRHIWFVGDEEHRFSTWNPAVTCPEGSTPAAMAEHGMKADEGDGGGDAHEERRDEGDDEGDDDRAAAAAMPETGAGDLVPGGSATLLALAALVLALAAGAGALRERARGASS